MSEESAEAGAEAKTQGVRAGTPGGEQVPDEAGTGPLAEFLVAVRRRPALTIFLFGLVMFTGGLVSVIGSQIRGAGNELPDAAGTTPATQASNAGRVGPVFGEPVGPYIERKKSTLSERARSDPQVPTLALVVFKEYRTAGQVEAFLSARSMQALTAQVRVPVRSFKPHEVPLESKSLAEASDDMRTQLNREVESLERVAASTEDPTYRTVYTNDVALYREALGKLTTDPATIFGVVVRATHANLASAARAGEVRFVDLPDDPTATLEDTTFAAVIPEDTETATFAVQ
ncbi:hypothetical protein BH23ACT12_BH23ACT12_09380 [soil metagenome]